MFPKDSAFKTGEDRRQAAMAAGAGQPPLRTPEEDQQNASRRTHAFIPVSDLERWALEIDEYAPMQKVARTTLDMEDLANEIRSYLP